MLSLILKIKYRGLFISVQYDNPLYNTAVAPQPCPFGHITADKKQNFILPKSTSANFFYLQNEICKVMINIE